MSQDDIGEYFEEFFRLPHHSVIPISSADTEYAGQWWVQVKRVIASTPNVYVAQARDSKRGPVAIKISHSAPIEKELDILNRLKDASVPNVTHAYGCFYFPSYCAIILPLFNRDLASIDTMGLREVVAMGKLMVSTLRIVHGLGIIHNDVKPENIVTSDQGKFCLVDWGAASIKKNNTLERRMPGTPRYMSVRTLEGKSGNERDDLESLLYTMIFALYHYLPWLSSKPSTEAQYLSLARKKRSFTVTDVSPSCPTGFQEFLTICRLNRKGTSVEYSELTSLLESVLKTASSEPAQASV